MQAYISLAVESLARPQELLYLKVRDVETHENYARISISEHGKEGIGKDKPTPSGTHKTDEPHFEIRYYKREKDAFSATI
jgi:hypothetical protein